MRSSPPSVYKRAGFFEGYNLDRPCLHQTVNQINTSAYTHLFFSFGTLDANYTVQVGTDTLSTYEFDQFLKLTGPARILTIGGWAFSTSPNTYNIFRTGVAASNRQTMANNIAAFVKSNNLDGVSIDWEYPGVSLPAPNTVGATQLRIENDSDMCLGSRYSGHPTCRSRRWCQLLGFPD